jgi:4'-phosphopantetheinyl transferase
MSTSSTWSAPPESLSLQPSDVHVWRVDLRQSENLIEEFRRTLHEDEIQRANRFHFEKHRKDYVVGRGFLRYVLGRYLDAEAKALQFSYGAYGKPALHGAHKDSRLCFNMSHSHGVALFAITQDHRLGVDVEQIRADFASEEIARRFFSPLEVDVFNALQPKERVAAFFRCWTRKEAYIKATGKGLSQSLDEFDVTLAPGVAAALLRACDDEVSGWFMSDVEVGSGFAAALAVEGVVSNIRYWQGLA